MSHDDKLKEAMEAIKVILDEKEIAGTVVLVSKTHAEFLHHFPVWSAIKWNKAGSGVNIKSKIGNFKNKEEQEKILEASVHIVMQNMDMASQSFGLFETIYKTLCEHMTIEHKSFSGFEPHKPGS